MRAITIIAATAICAASAQAFALDLRPTVKPPSKPGDITHLMPRVERGKLIDPMAPAPVKKPPNVVDKVVDKWNNAPIRPNVNTSTKPPTPVIEFNKRF